MLMGVIQKPAAILKICLPFVAVVGGAGKGGAVY
jgi:hypothetical protein